VCVHRHRAPGTWWSCWIRESRYRCSAARVHSRHPTAWTYTHIVTDTHNTGTASQVHHNSSAKKYARTLTIPPQAARSSCLDLCRSLHINRRIGMHHKRTVLESSDIHAVRRRTVWSHAARAPSSSYKLLRMPMLSWRIALRLPDLQPLLHLCDCRKRSLA